MLEAKKKKKDQPKVIVVAHDAGAGEIIGAYLKRQSDKLNIHAYVLGPAQKIFAREHIPHKPAPATRKGIVKLLKLHSDSGFLLAGSGWMTMIECTAVNEAKKIGLKSVVYLESWNNYRERFGYPSANWKENLPDEFWVGDKEALALAKKFFPKTPIKLKLNQYFINTTTRYKALRAKRKHHNEILFLSDVSALSTKTLTGLLSVMAKSTRKSLTLTIRFHPADDRTRYDTLIKKYKDSVHITCSTQKDIARDLSQARLVIGTETVALVVAVLAGIKTVNILPAKVKSQLPFSKIIRVTNATQIANLI